jgi:hypothetical protein
MCKWIKSGNTRIDPCMRNKITLVAQSGCKVLACCCGHKKYSETIVVEKEGVIREFWSSVFIPRKKRFYKRDKTGRFYIPEVDDGYNKRLTQN